MIFQEAPVRPFRLTKAYICDFHGPPTCIQKHRLHGYQLQDKRRGASSLVHSSHVPLGVKRKACGKLHLLRLVFETGGEQVPRRTDAKPCEKRAEKCVWNCRGKRSSFARRLPFSCYVQLVVSPSNSSGACRVDLSCTYSVGFSACQFLVSAPHYHGCAVSTDGHGACLRAPLCRFLADTLRGGSRRGATNRW